MADSVSMVFVSLIVSIVFFIIYGYLYWVENKKYILLWTLAWGILFMAYLSRYFIANYSNHISILLFNYLATLGTPLLVYLGTLQFLRKTKPKWFYPLYTAVAVWSVFCLTMNLQQLTYLITTSILIGLSYIQLGYFFSITTLTENRIKQLVSCLFSLWGMMVILGPFFRHYDNLISIGYLAVGIAGLMSAVGLIFIYFITVKDELIAHREKTSYLTYHDVTTGLFNRRYFETHIAELDCFDNLPLSILYGDMNGLKLVNDTFGHQKGDEFLQLTADILRNACPKSSTIIRMGGDEFIVLLPKTGTFEANHLISTIKEICSHHKPEIIPLSIALGSAEKASTQANITTVIKTAEDQMYRMKLRENLTFRNSVISSLKQLLWEKDYPSGDHDIRLKGWARVMGGHLKLSNAETEELALAASLHDIGKISLPENLLKKPTPLCEAEWDMMKKHSEAGYRITQSVSQLAHISNVILSHHEWWDGSGYPLGLKGDEIPLNARIIAIIDAFDVMTHHRPYKPMVSPASALQTLKKMAGIQFDPKLVEVFEQCVILNMDKLPASIPSSRQVPDYPTGSREPL